MNGTPSGLLNEPIKLIHVTKDTAAYVVAFLIFEEGQSDGEYIYDDKANTLTVNGLKDESPVSLRFLADIDPHDLATYFETASGYDLDEHWLASVWSFFNPAPHSSAKSRAEADVLEVVEKARTLLQS